MRCPKCGAFLDNNKTICFMCGATLNNENVEENVEMNNDNNNSFDNGFNNVNPFGNSFDNNQMNNDSFSNSFNNDSFNNFEGQNNNGFNNPNVNDLNNNPTNNFNVGNEEINNKIFGRKDEVVFNDDYKNIKLEDIKTDKDMFDFFSEHKKGIKFFFLGLLVLGVGFGIFMFVKNKMAPEKKEPLIGNLYFVIEDDFDLIENSQTGMVYSLTGSKGSDCSISISSGTTTSGNHVLDFFDSNVKKFEPEKDRDGNIINPLKVFNAETNEFEVNDQLWSRQYFYYRADLNSAEYSLLKNIFLSTMYKGYYYDISLVNNSNSTTCNVALDSFVNTLEFVEKSK